VLTSLRRSRLRRAHSAASIARRRAALWTGSATLSHKSGRFELWVRSGPPTTQRRAEALFIACSNGSSNLRATQAGSCVPVRGKSRRIARHTGESYEGFPSPRIVICELVLATIYGTDWQVSGFLAAVDRILQSRSGAHQRFSRPWPTILPVRNPQDPSLPNFAGIAPATGETRTHSDFVAVLLHNATSRTLLKFMQAIGHKARCQLRSRAGSVRGARRAQTGIVAVIGRRFPLQRNRSRSSSILPALPPI